MDTTFDEFLARARSGQDLVVPGSWAQGRTLFGGVSAGVLCEALLQHVENRRRLRYLDVVFQRPVEPDVPFRIEVDEMAGGRTVAIRSARIVQGEQTRVAVRANFIAALDSSIGIETFRAPELPAHDDRSAIRVGGPKAPAFTQHVDFRVVTGGLPFQANGVPELGGWMRFDEAPEVLTTSHLVCLIDCWPPVPISYYDRPVPMSSINWQIHLAEPVDGVRGEQYLGYLAHCNFFRDGYGSSSAEVWAPDGRLLAKSFQTFVVFG